jgi:hypothetical protein
MKKYVLFFALITLSSSGFASDCADIDHAKSLLGRNVDAFKDGMTALGLDCFYRRDANNKIAEIHCIRSHPQSFSDSRLDTETKDLANRVQACVHEDPETDRSSSWFADLFEYKFKRNDITVASSISHAGGKTKIVSLNLSADDGSETDPEED